MTLSFAFQDNWSLQLVHLARATLCGSCSGGSQLKTGVPWRRWGYTGILEASWAFMKGSKTMIVRHPILMGYRLQALFCVLNQSPCSSYLRLTSWLVLLELDAPEIIVSINEGEPSIDL